MPRLMRNIGMTYVSRIAAIGSAFLLFPFIAHHVGLEAYGVYLLMYGLTSFFSTDLGLGSSVIRYVNDADVTGDHEQLDRVISTSVAFFAGLAASMALVFVIVVALAWNHLNIPDDQRDLALAIVPVVGIGFVLIGPPLSVFRNVLAGLQRFDLAARFALVQVAIRVALTVPLLLAGLGVMTVAVVEAVAFAASGALCARQVRRLRPGVRLRPRYVSGALLREMAPYGGQVLVMTLAALVILQADQVIIGLVLPIASVALYVAAFRLYQVSREVMQSIFVPLVSDAARAHATNDRERVRILLVRGTRMANAGLVCIAVPMLVIAEPVLHVWAGERFAEVGPVAQLLLLGLLVNNLHVIAIPILMGAGRLATYAKLHALWAVSNIVLSVVLASTSLGLKGIALGTTIPVVLLEPIYIAVVLRHTGVSWREFADRVVLRSYGVAVLPALGLALVAQALSFDSLPAIAAVFVVHAAVFVSLYAVVNPEDRGFTRRLATRLRPSPVPAAR